MKRTLLLSLLFPFLSLHAATIDTVAGNGKAGYEGDGGAAINATLNQPFGVIVGPDKDIYFTDTNNHSIRKISHHTEEISTVVGTGKKGYTGDGGPANEATCNEPYELRFAPNGDLYWVERLNHVVRKLDAKTGKVSTVAGNGKAGFSGDGGPANEASMNQPHSIQFDAKHENLLICDISNNRIRAVSMKTGKITTWCGNGKKDATPDGAKVSAETPLKGPRALDIAPNGDLWLALREGNAIYRIDAKTEKLEHVAGTGKQGFTGNGGPAKDATLSGPKGVAISPDGKMVYLADTESHTVRAIDLSKTPPTLELIAGDGKKGDGPDSPDPLKCRMARLHGIGIDPESGDLYIGDSETNKVRVVRGLGK
jgi:Gluconolactonase